MKDNLRTMLCQPCAHDSAGSVNDVSRNIEFLSGGVGGFPPALLRWEGQNWPLFIGEARGNFVGISISGLLAP